MFPRPLILPAKLWDLTFCWPLLFLLVLALASPVRAELRLTEILAQDNDILADEEGDHSDWIELLNTGPQAVSLLGYGLSDDPDQPFRWTFPALSLEAGSRLVVFASGKDRSVPAGPTNAAPVELSPDQINGLQWWVDAADSGTLMLDSDRVVQWRDKSGRRPIDDYPAPQAPAALAGKVLWLDAGDEMSVEGAGGAVTRWLDRSGTGNDAAQPMAGQRPVRVIASSGLPHLRFDGQDDVLDFARDVSVQTLVWVGVESGLVANVDRRPLVGHSDRFDFLRGQNRFLLGNHPAMPPGILNATVYLNGVRVNPFATALPPGLNVVIIAGTGPAVFNNLADDRALPQARWWGEVAEIIGFDRSLTEPEALGLDRHLRAKWQGVSDPLAPDYSARQDRPAWQPRLTEDPLTGLPAVRFDGVDDRMPFPEVKQVQSIFLVVREGEYATDSYRPFLGHHSSAAMTRGTDRLLLYSGSPQTWMEGRPVNPLATRPPPRRVLLTFVFPSPIPLDNLGMDRIYDELILDGDVHEVALFDRALAEPERAGLEAWLNRKWLLPDRRLHANFSLAATGETVRLTAPDGRLVDATPELTSRPDRSQGRLGDGLAWGWFEQPTPGQGNPAVAAESGLTPPPTVTPPAGFLAGPTQVQLLPAADSPPDTRIYYTLDGSDPAAHATGIWVEDGLPPGATFQTANDPGWTWGRMNPLPASGARSLQSGTVAGLHQYVINLSEPLLTGEDGLIHFELWCDPAARPRSVMFLAHAGGSWNHLAYWGEDLIAKPSPEPAGQLQAGSLPAAGRWQRMAVPVTDLALAHAAISRLAFIVYDGRAAFDALGYTQEPLPQIYSGPFTLARSAVVRARAVAPGRLASQAHTASYLDAPPGGLPVVSLSTAPANLFDEVTGIYASGPPINAAGQPRVFNYERNWERPVHAELFEPDGTRGFAVDCGLKIHGAYTRNWPQRSLRLHFRRRYGLGALEYPLFPDHPVERFDSLILRNGGNDWNSAYLRDELAHGLAADLGLGHQAARPAHVFLNGEYWGVMPLREHANDDTIRRQHGLAADLDVVKNELEVVSGDKLDHQNLFNTALAAMNNPVRHPLLAARINASNYWDWLGLEFFAGNVDWPGNNVLAWRSRAAGQPWHWMLVDCDGGFFAPRVSHDIVSEMLSSRPMVGNASITLAIMRGLLNNAGYRQQFARRLGDLLNTTFSADHTLPMLDALEAELTPAMPAQIARWKDSFSFAKPLGSALQNLEAWQDEVSQVRQFLRDRPAAFREHVRNHFSLGPDITLAVHAEPTARLHRLRVATLDFTPSQLPWAGTYFAGLPVEIVVEPAPGFRLAGWSDGEPASPSRTVIPNEAISLTALLEPDPDFEPDTLVPRPHQLAAGDFMFGGWPADSPAGTYPPAMIFETTAAKDPVLTDPMTDWWTGRYDLTSRSRIKGLGNAGVSFINTSDPQTGQGYVGAALAALRTTGMKDILVDWTGGTVTANPRSYGLRLQWRMGTNGTFADVLDALGQPVEYVRNPVSGHRQVFAGIRLPSAADDQPVVQLRWRYHALPQPDDSGARTELLLDDIRITGTVMQTTPFTLRVTMDNNRAVLFVQGAAQAACALWVSADLAEWTLVETKVTGADGRAEFENVPGDNGARFYQVRTP